MIFYHHENPRRCRSKVADGARDAKILAERLCVAKPIAGSAVQLSPDPSRVFTPNTSAQTPRSKYHIAN